MKRKILDQQVLLDEKNVVGGTKRKGETRKSGEPGSVYVLRVNKL